MDAEEKGIVRNMTGTISLLIFVTFLIVWVSLTIG